MNLKQNIFEQPEGYQNDLKEKLMQQITVQDKFAVSMLKPVLAIAASVLLLFGITYYYQLQSNNKLQTLTAETVFEYYYENIDELDEEDIYTVLEVSLATDNDDYILLDEIIFDDDTISFIY